MQDYARKRKAAAGSILSIDLDPRCTERLQERLASALREILVNNRQFLDYDTSAKLRPLNDVLPKSGAVKKTLDGIFGDDDRLQLYVEDWISRRLKEMPYQSDIRADPLFSISGFSDEKEVASQIVADFCRLPYRYSVWLPMGPKPTIETLADPVSDTNPARIHRIDDTFRAKYPPHPTQEPPKGGMLMGLLGATPDQQYPEVGLCVQVDVEGFIDRWGTSFTAASAIERIRAMLGLGLANLVFKLGPNQSSFFTGFTRGIHRNIFVHRSTDDGSVRYDAAFQIDRNFSEVVDSLAEHDPRDVSLDPKTFVRYAEISLDQIRSVFRFGPRADRTMRAARWLFDSYLGSNDLLSFVQAMVAIEIILGDKEASDLVGLTELLANRCAYLLGGTHAERDQILEQMRSIYRVRSQIVHQGKSRLNSEEWQMLHQLRLLCRQLLLKEMELLIEPQRRIAKLLAGNN
jgi:hypothetical protein